MTFRLLDGSGIALTDDLGNNLVWFIPLGELASLFVIMNVG